MRHRTHTASRDLRDDLLAEIADLAEIALAGSASQSYRTCGNKQCKCHGPGPKHGPHMYVSYRGSTGKTTGYYVPQAAQADVLAGIEAWRALQEKLRELSALNQARALKREEDPGE